MDNFNNQVDNTPESTVDYSQPGTFAGATAEWQANNAREELPTFTESFGDGYSAPVFEEAPVPEKKKMVGVAIVSMILGILSILCCYLGAFNLITAIPSLILGIVTIVKKFAGKGMAIAGIICASIAIVLGLIITIGYGGLLSASSSSYYY